MKSNILKSVLLIITVILFNSCCTSRNAESTITDVNYDKDKNVTEYLVFPYGEVLIPGKWTKSNYNRVSRQQFFINEDSTITIAVVLGRTEKYEFNKNNDFKGYSFVNKFYKWDTEYFISNFNFKRELLEEDKKNNLIIYRIYGKVKQDNVNTYFLISNNNGYVKNLSISITDKWNKEEKITFLKKMYFNKRE